MHVPIETVADAQRRAKRILPKPVYTAVIAGNEAGATIKGNPEAFTKIGFRPVVGVEIVPERDLSTSVLGQKISLPVVVSPAAAQAIHPDGEVAVAQGAARADTPIGQSTLASSDFKEVAAANPKAFYQLSWSGSREVIEARVERMRSFGAKGLIITLDATMTQPRDWGSPVIPQNLDLKTMIRYAPMGLGNPRWLARYLRRGKLPDLSVPNLQDDRDEPPTMVEGMIEWTQTAIPTWGDVKWLGETWGGPYMVKGILTSEDARRAVDAGATAIGVSNHGGNNLDTTPSPLRFLPGVIKAVGGQTEVTFDSGIRRGADVVKVLALGATAALIGRSWFFGLAANGARGVYEVLEAYRLSIDRTLIGLGKSSIKDLSPDDLIVPEGYFLKNGDDLPMTAR